MGVKNFLEHWDEQLQVAIDDFRVRHRNPRRGIRQLTVASYLGQTSIADTWTSEFASFLPSNC